MVKICCVDGCVSSSDTIYFRFPNSRTLRKKWLNAITPRVTVTKDSHICSQHFQSDEYETVRGKTRLKSKVIPSIFNIEKSPTPPEISVTSECLDVPVTFSPPIDNDADNTSRDPLDHREVNIPNGNIEPDKSCQQPNTDSMESNKDLEEIITNYHIKQIRPVEPLPREAEKGGENGETAGENIIEVSIDVSREIETNLIEIDVDKGRGRSNQECLMLLENVQVDVDPSLMFPGLGEEPTVDPDVIDVDDNKVDQDCQMLLENVEVDVDPNVMFPGLGEEPTVDPDVIVLDNKKEDPVSLLTSSDEDDVILQEPKIDTVELSSENEDDVPLVKLVKRKKKPLIRDILWGKCEYYCVECNFTTMKKSEYRHHLNTHSTIIHMCQICKYTTPSKYQFQRHQKKHRCDKKYTCHLCSYSARHSMSLSYHMKSHGLEIDKCKKCGFQSSVLLKVYKHMRTCNKTMFKCDQCDYETLRKSDLKRHRTRRHPEEAQEDEDYIPT